VHAIRNFRLLRRDNVDSNLCRFTGCDLGCSCFSLVSPGGFQNNRSISCRTAGLVAGLLARSQYLEGHSTGHLDTGFSWFPCVYKRMLRWFLTLQVATACFSCSPPVLNFLDPYFIFTYVHNNHCHRTIAHLQLNILLLLLLLSLSSSSSSSSSPLCRVFIFIFLRRTMSLGNTVLQLFCCYYSCCLYR